MKLNLALFAILCSLITLAFFNEETPERLQRLELEKSQQLYDASALGALQGLSTPQAKVLKGGDYYYTAGDYRIADNAMVEKVFEILSHIRARRHLTDEELKLVDRSQLFPSSNQLFTFYFENGNLTYLLGNKLNFDRSFYMEISNSMTHKKQIVVAFDESADEGAYPEEVFHRTAEKYNRLHNILKLPESFFHDLHVLRRSSVDQLMADWKQIEIESLRNPTFSIDLVAKKTTPAIFSGLTYRPAQFSLILNDLVKLKAKSLIAKGDRSQLKNLDFSFSITKKSGKKEKIEIFRNYQSNADVDQWYLVTTFSDDIFVMDSGSVNSIRFHHQDFWLLSFFAEINEWPMLIDFSFTVDDVLTKMQLNRRGGFEVKMLDHAKLIPQQASFQKLFQLMGKDAAYAILVNDKRDDSDLLGKAIATLTLFERTFKVIRHGDDIYILEVEKSVALVYPNAAKDFPKSSIDYYLLKEEK